MNSLRSWHCPAADCIPCALRVPVPARPPRAHKAASCLKLHRPAGYRASRPAVRLLILLLPRSPMAVARSRMGAPDVAGTAGVVPRGDVVRTTFAQYQPNLLPRLQEGGWVVRGPRFFRKCCQSGNLVIPDYPLAAPVRRAGSEFVRCGLPGLLNLRTCQTLYRGVTRPPRLLPRARCLTESGAVGIPGAVGRSEAL